jgi:hypothetical protein
VLPSRFVVEQAENLFQHVPLHGDILRFGRQALAKNEVGSNRLNERRRLHGGRIARVDATHQVTSVMYRPRSMASKSAYPKKPCTREY